MGPKDLILDHQLTYEIWSDPLFWELAPSWLTFREEAETSAAEAQAMRTSLLIKSSKLYNDWINEILISLEKNTERLHELVNYIKQRRNHKQERITVKKGNRYIEIAGYM